MQRLYATLTKEQADVYALVLSSAGVPCLLKKDGGNGWSLWVAEHLADSARQSIERYSLENPNWAPRMDSEDETGIKTYTAVWVCLLLVSAFIAAGNGEEFRRVAESCGVSVREILNGEVYRAATALMLHATPAHLAGNLVGIALFGTAVCSITGPGVGWLAILLTGIAGNLANALVIRSVHLSLGASTAVFGAVGILTAIRFYRKKQVPDRRFKAWLPLAGGLALLGFLGTGTNADLPAHLLGFAAGIIFGLGYARWMHAPLSDRYQALCLSFAIAILAGSWFWAYFSP